MSFFYVYAPQNATSPNNVSSYWDTSCSSSGSRYCSGTCHPKVYGSNPIDIICPFSTRLDFWSSPISGTTTYAVGSLVCSTISSMCLNPNIPAPWRTGLVIKMKAGVNGGGSELGQLLYGHVDSPFVGTVNCINGGVTYLGYVAPSDPPCTYCMCGGLCKEECCDCYQGHHVHVESVNALAKNTALGCTSQVYPASTWLYQFSV